MLDAIKIDFVFLGLLIFSGLAIGAAFIYLAARPEKEKKLDKPCLLLAFAILLIGAFFSVPTIAEDIRYWDDMPNHLNVYIYAPGTITHREEIVNSIYFEIINKLPPQLVNLTDVIAFVDKFETISNTFEERNETTFITMGTYDIGRKRVLIRLSDIKSMKGYLAHELSHAYWYQKMTQEQQQEWALLYPQKHVSFYAETTDTKEDFAETGRCLLTETRCSISQAKADFMEKNFLTPLNLNYTIQCGNETCAIIKS